MSKWFQWRKIEQCNYWDHIIFIGDLSNLSPFDFFRQETSNQDAVIRVEAMKKVGIVAALMGPEKARTDMLAYLQSK